MNKIVFIGILLVTGCSLTPTNIAVPMCDSPQMIVAASDTTDETISSVKRAIARWNKNTGVWLFVYGGRADFNSYSAPLDSSIIVVRNLSDSESPTPNTVSNFEFVRKNNCTASGIINVYENHSHCQQQLFHSMVRIFGKVLGVESRFSPSVPRCDGFDHASIEPENAELIRRHYGVRNNVSVQKR